MAENAAAPMETEGLDEIKIPDSVPIVANAHYVMFPSMIAPVLIQGENDLKMIDEVIKGDRLIGVFAVREGEGNGEEGAKEASFSRIYGVGTIGTILKMLRIPDGTVRLLVHGVRRVRIKEELQTKPFLRAAIEPFQMQNPADAETLASMKGVLNLLKSFLDSTGQTEDILIAATNTKHPGKLADLIASNLQISIKEQQDILEIEDPKLRLLKVQEILTRELEIVSLGAKIQTQIKSKIEKTQRDYMLREQMKAIRKELGEDEEGGSEVEELRGRIKKAKLPEKVKAVAERELKKIETTPPANPEYAVSRTYLDWILSLPWTQKTRDNIVLKKAQKILDEDHFDLEKVKEKILEYLAVVKLRKAIKGPILCLVGAPGVGKTSLGRSIARAMGRKFVRISLGGMRDEAEIRGHRRTYIGSMPGRVIAAMKECGTINPVILMDEIDKLSTDFRGDPASAMLEVLDPEQNATFTDHYLDLPYDLSNVMFIMTANVIDNVPDPLLDRMEVIELSGYTLREKVQIARRYLIPKAVANAGISEKMIEFTEAGIETIIEHYTLEAGLRNLERELNNLCRKVARRIAEGQKKAFKADPESVEKALGPWKYTRDEAVKRANVPGVAVGLAWTAVGGDILFIETSATPGRGDLVLTGQLGDVMKESAQAAYTFLQSHAEKIGISPNIFRRKTLHLHVPEGATPKDGPSAGMAMMLSLASLFLDRPIIPKLAMTGEITLKGAILPVGGIKEKVLAAHRSGVRTLMLPKENERDLINVPKEVKDELTFHFVERAEQALAIAFPNLPIHNGAKDHSKPARSEHLRQKSRMQTRK